MDDEPIVRDDPDGLPFIVFVGGRAVATRSLSELPANLPRDVISFVAEYKGTINSFNNLLPCTALVSLSLSGCQITSLAGLEQISWLTRLDVYDNRINSLDPLSSLLSLHTLEVGDNAVTSLEPLSCLSGLHALTLNSNQVSSLVPLSGLTLLHRLSARDNLISSLEPLASLTSLVQLQLSRFIEPVAPFNPCT